MRRTVLGSIAVALAVCSAPAAVTTASAAPAAKLDVAFSALPAQVFEGQTATFKLDVGGSATSCALQIRYNGGRLQKLSAHAVKSGVAAWAVRIAAAPAGYAKLTATCAGSGRVTARVLVQWPLEAPKLSVVKRGFSQRNDQSNSSSTVNYGLAIANQRVHLDATGIAVLINFVDATNRVLGTSHVSIGRVPAGTTIYMGGQVGLNTATQVSRLEVVFVQATSSQHLPALQPLVSDVVLTPTADGYLDWLGGQLLNRYPRPLQGGDIGVVFEDDAGNIVGGGEGGASGPVSLGAREVFQVNSGFNVLPIAKIASTLISIVPSYPSS
jgi:hypothetical protein